MEPEESLESDVMPHFTAFESGPLCVWVCVEREKEIVVLVFALCFTSQH
jgi:hypothetical protein